MPNRAGVYPSIYQDEHFANYLANNNPYAPMTTLYGSPNTPVAKTFTDLQAGGDWITAQRNNARAAIGPGPIYQPGAGWNPASGKASPWTAKPIAPYQPAGAVAGQEPNPFSVVSNPKNTQITSLLDKVLAQAGNSISGAANSNPYSLFQNTKDQEQASAIAGARDRFGNATAGTQQQLADFTRDYLGGNAAAKDFATQETGSIGQYYSGGVQNDLNRLAKERELAVARTTERALDRARGGLNQQRFMGGDSSRLQSQYLNTVTDVMANEARQQADLNRANYLTVRGGQDTMAGRRQALLDQSLSRGLLPLNASYAQSAAELSQLGQLGNLTGQNTVYNQDTAESRMARQLGVLGQASNLDQQNTFYNLRRPYEPDFSGYAPTGARRGTGGGYPLGPGDDPNYDPGYQPEPDFRGGPEPDFRGGLNPNDPYAKAGLSNPAGVKRTNFRPYTGPFYTGPQPYYQPGGDPNFPDYDPNFGMGAPTQVPYAPYEPSGAARSGWDDSYDFWDYY